jgi:hypothetical protein
MLPSDRSIRPTIPLRKLDRGIFSSATRRSAGGYDRALEAIAMTELKRVLYNGWFWVGMLLTLLVRATWFS